MRPRAFVFDAYGTLFDVSAATRRAAAEPGFGGLTDQWPALAGDWRRKQLEYSWLRTLMGAHADFATVTAEALDWALEARGLGANRTLRARLLALYDDLPGYGDVHAALTALRDKGARLAILSNGSPDMLRRVLVSSGIGGLIEMALSVEEIGAFKPAPQVYGLVEARLGLPRGQVMYVSANTWDVAGAARFGFTTAWINRSGAPLDRLPHGPAHILPDLSRLAEFA
jgi:2-haloacid dehalogenase